ncbi:unnamed protein product [Moneuplotes crassus]|uniref:EF-hand domain-containing protein n=1 Tax=Euplotes crassus TaxID=5936 RepID=A0AAD1TZS5_EUPCR|nr:unnamed protein product [Moneuplotes crassus]
MNCTIASKRMLADLFAAIAELEIKCEMARLNLAENPFFEPFNTFTILDIEKHGQLRDADIFNFCLENGIPCNYGDASLLIAQYDENSNGKLSFTEFTQFALPATNGALREKAASRDYVPDKTASQVLPSDLCVLIADLFAAELDFQRVTGMIKQDLNLRVDFTTKHAFGWMDISKPLGGIDRHDIRQFVDYHARYLNEEELDAIIRRCDTDGDESISYLEFLEVVQGIQSNIPTFSKAISYERERLSSPIRGVHVTTTYHSPGRIRPEPVVTTVERSPGRVSTTTRSPGRITTVNRSPMRVKTHHFSPPIAHVQYSPYKEVRTQVKESPRPSDEIRTSSARRSPPRYTGTRDSPFSRTVTSFTRKDNTKPFGAEFLSGNSARVESRYVDSGAREPFPRVTRITRSPQRVTTVTHSPERITRIIRSPGRVHVKETNHYSPRSVHVKEYTPYSPCSVHDYETSHYFSRGSHIEETKHYSPSRVHVTRNFHSSVRPSSLLKGFEEEELAQSLIQLITVEGKLEAAKEALAQRPNFTIHDAFNIFDFSGYGRIEPFNVKDGLARFGVMITVDEARLIVSRYDKNRDESLRFDEFSAIFFPLDRAFGDSLDHRNRRFPNGYYPTPDIVDPVTREDFVRVLRLVVETENLAEHIRQKHSERPLFDRTDAFDAINRFGSQSITQGDFQDLLARHRFFATDKELGSLMDRFDKTKKGSVAYSEFVDEITPHSPVRY